MTFTLNSFHQRKNFTFLPRKKMSLVYLVKDFVTIFFRGKSREFREGESLGSWDQCSETGVTKEKSHILK